MSHNYLDANLLLTVDWYGADQMLLFHIGKLAIRNLNLDCSGYV